MFARVLRWVLVWAVALSVIGMHHVGTQPSSSHPTVTVTDCRPPDTTSEHSPTRHGEQDLLHLCLAILGAALALILALVAWRGTPPAQRVPTSTTPLRPPRTRGAPALLANLCVLRL
ncbi:MAG: hypothetical protein HOY78_20110 [Saccharothrix sp.]|nr:hypothetical protein [Saccharothrix sp.]